MGAAVVAWQLPPSTFAIAWQSIVSSTPEGQPTAIEPLQVTVAVGVQGAPFSARHADQPPSAPAPAALVVHCIAP